MNKNIFFLSLIFIQGIQNSFYTMDMVRKMHIETFGQMHDKTHNEIAEELSRIMRTVFSSQTQTQDLEDALNEYLNINLN